MHLSNFITSLLILFPLAASQTTNNASAVFVFDASTTYQYIFALSIDSTTRDLYMYISGPSTDSWLGFGFGTTMKDSLIFITYIDDTGTSLTLSPRIGNSNAEPTYTPTITCTTSSPGSTIDTTTSIMSGSFKCTNTTLSPTNPAQPMLFAIGPPSLPLSSSALTAPLRMHDYHGTFTMNLPLATTPNATIPTPNNTWTTLHASPPLTFQSDSTRLPAAHGVLMCGVFIFIFPLGALMLRLKHFVRAHAVVQVFGMGLFGVAVGLGGKVAGMYNRSRHWDSPHQVLGLVVLGALVLQVGLGVVGHRGSEKGGKRTGWSLGHWILGPVVILLGLVNGGVGWVFAGNPWNVLQYYICIVVAVALLFGAARATLFCLAKRRKRREMPEPEETGYQYPQFGSDAPPVYGSPQDVPLHTFFAPPPQQKSNVVFHSARVR